MENARKTIEWKSNEFSAIFFRRAKRMRESTTDRLNVREKEKKAFKKKKKRRNYTERADLLVYREVRIYCKDE